MNRSRYLRTRPYSIITTKMFIVFWHLTVNQTYWQWTKQGLCYSAAREAARGQYLMKPASVVHCHIPPQHVLHLLDLNIFDMRLPGRNTLILPCTNFFAFCFIYYHADCRNLMALVLLLVGCCVPHCDVIDAIVAASWWHAWRRMCTKIHTMKSEKFFL